ncbi:MAG: M23 family metallopeptidase [Methylobacterium mesophilicum]|nr:M23 family metallopeptidase [Methylobacterium mesophilicum]
MHDVDPAIAELGNEPPLNADAGRKGPPDRREVSLRWLAGTFLTGLTSSVLMGMALFAALDGREKIATPPEVADITGEAGAGSGQDAKAARVVPPKVIARARDKRRMEVSTLSREGDREVVRMMPFVQVKMALAANNKTSTDYPPFDPLQVFSEDGEKVDAQANAASTGTIYGAKVEGEVSLKTLDFPMESAPFDEKSELSADEVEAVVRSTAAGLTDGDVQVAALHYVDPQRFGDGIESQTTGAPSNVRIVPENLSVAARSMQDDESLSFAEEIIPFPEERDMEEALSEAGYAGEDAQAMASAFARILNSPVLKAGSVLRLGLEVRGEDATIVRASLYDRTRHIVTIALDDRRQYVAASEPEPNPELLSAFDGSAPRVAHGNLPTVYDGIYRAAYSYGMSPALTKQLVRLLASDVDFQSRVGPSDTLDVFFSQPGANDQMSDESELLYVSANFGGTTRNFFRFRAEDGSTDYFDDEGRSSRQFLLRNPVPNGVFRSGFGSRRHPVLGITRMHTGVDWAAPTGTPIIAAGSGVVEKAGWAGGYGRQTIVRHKNGYATWYNHQNAFAKGIKPGVEVRQGQVIGYVGATGLVTGPHLHYELLVNGAKVDPMRVRLPGGRVLGGKELEAFKRERDRILDLLKDESKPGTKVAANG